MRDDRIEAKREADALDEPAEEARELAERLGLEPYPVRYWVVDHDQMNELIAYGGFQRRYPHWRWGMNYERQRKKDRHGLGKAFEIVNNDDPAHAFLQESNAAADQKAVITHVEAHADFFANNEWFGLYADRGEGGPNAAARLERNADRIAAIAKRADVDRDEVERLIDAVSALEDTIDQHSPVDAARSVEEPGIADDVSGDGDDALDAIEARIDDLDLSEEVRRDVFDDEWLEARGEGVEPEEPRPDVLAFLRDHGKRYDPDSGKAVDREPWETTVVDAIREEAYYFAGQKQTKVMNEGWATYWESLMMGGEGFAGEDEFLTYADHMSRVLGSPGLNPYKLGFELWTHVELRAARREVIDKLLRVDGVTPENFHSRIDLDEVATLLEPHPAVAGAGPATLDELADLAADGDPRVDAEAVDRALSARREDGDGASADGEEIDVERYPWKLLTREGLAERHYVLSRPEHRGALRNVSRETLEEQARYLFDVDRYATVAEAIADVDRAAGWERMFEVRESHNDVTFIDAFLTDEFVREGNYFTYEYSRAAEEHRVASVDADDVRKKLLLRFTNFGKPTIVVLDGNFRNRGELLIGHRYNGVALDEERAKATLKRVFELWGRPVNLATIRVEYDDGAVRRAKRRGEEPEGTEVGVRFQYDGGEVTEHDLDESIRERITADEVDYDTKPDDWLA
ncbi:SpoVR family protein [Halorubrum ezzemoulense]|uniref:AbrB family transcriptional regulator n=1 Tax=Halorubrum ezzemoulense TaxID=337243 RepID=A0A256KP36_HALEZ|nr:MULTISPECIES: SpoVR family protein [Halorubrum]MDB2238597.1 SpoVR family protein [Halorubrum ezzemoulense]MDB2242263.1 SpoVR family protein [Halorubrum ezzemoulense]MDB2246047.1 SpoVR family protein [Halorubrum ezzemoulense]MDB2249228.1 SpoVR family protein [Halorubrum ezzemoulense]MDB2252834.1 SpoVR family protein [Halorubrum ezzemoulense]